MKKIIAAAILTLSALFSVFAASSESAVSAFVEGCKAYAEGDWQSAKFMLRKAVYYPENLNPDVYYMLITSEVYDSDYKSALEDCDIYIENFPDTIYYPYICYQKGKLLYNLGEYEKAIITLSDFCHQNEKNELYSHALFYIGESLFACYKYDEAEQIFVRIVTEYPDSPKTSAAQYRIDTILQRTREEKLLYLLKQTGEEYLSAKEEYEKQLRLYNSEGIDLTKQRLVEAQSKNEQLEAEIAELQSKITSLEAEKAAEKVDVPESEPYDERTEQIRILKKKAQEAQKILNQRNQGKSEENDEQK